MNDELEQIGLRAPVGTKARIQEHIGYGRPYRDLTDFIIAAIDEKLDPKRKKEETKELIRQAFLEDPTLMEDHIANIGIRYFAKKQSD